MQLSLNHSTISYIHLYIFLGDHQCVFDAAIIDLLRCLELIVNIRYNYRTG